VIAASLHMSGTSTFFISENRQKKRLRHSSDRRRHYVSRMPFCIIKKWLFSLQLNKIRCFTGSRYRDQADAKGR